ncbi:MAG: TetR/AcrR family transcriptional regulator [Deltaproteobacteria bacterium]|nr:TetR/AcrR family transcriptional regulator [Candidatus Zymogenaceae bacterium]
MNQQDKTQVILDAAIRVFARKGYYGARVSDIANEAGIAYGLVYHYFKNKEDLLLSIFRTRWDQFLDAIRSIMETGTDPAEMIRKVISFLFHSYKNNPAMIEVMIMDVTKSTRFLNDENISHFLEAFSLITQIVDLGKDSNIFKPDIDSTMTAYTIYGSVERMMLLWILRDQKSITIEEAKSASNMVSTILLNGMIR